MIVHVPISIGELLDKISILLIKKDKITDKNKLEYIENELEKLKSVLDSTDIKNNKTTHYLSQLKDINLKLWNIENDIRVCERKNIFDEKFIELARSVYKFNDQRAIIKSHINKEFQSTIIEVKSYK